MCKVPAHEDKILRLFPSELNDLDNVLTQRYQKDPNRTLALPGMSLEQSTQLLDELLEFHWLMQHYVLGVLGLNPATLRAAGVRIDRLARHWQVHRTGDTSIEHLLDSVRTIVERLDMQGRCLEEKETKLAETREKLRTEHYRLRDRSTQLKTLEAEVKKREAALQAKADEVIKSRAALLTDAADLEQRLKTTRQQEEKAKEDARQTHSEAMRARVEARQLVASKEEDVRARLAEMEERLRVAQNRQQEAEAERDAHRQKEHAMADQMRTLGSKIKECKAALQAERKRKRSDDERRDGSVVTTSVPPSTSGTSAHRSESQRASPSWAGRTFVTADQGTTSADGLSAAAHSRHHLPLQDLAGSFNNAADLHRSQRKRSLVDDDDLSIAYYNANGEGDDLDDDVPMPGLPARHLARKSTSSSTVKWSRETSEVAAARAREKYGPSTQSSGGSLMRMTIDLTRPLLLPGAKGVVTGPKQKVRDAY
ncbi:unnamed protein product [Parajaminaea phylloscopi]